MTPSTTRFISYDLRPAKQTERRILLDFLNCANEPGTNISDCRYVGMGGTKFYDFHLLHRFLGIKRMTSIEQDRETHGRAVYSCPYDFITVSQTSVAEFLAADADKTRTIYWFDYDGGLSAEITADIMSLGTKLTVGGFAFVTVNANPMGILRELSNERRLEHFQQELGDFSIDLTSDAMEYSTFPNTVRRVLITAFKNSFAARTDGEFRPLFQVQYKDSTRMITVGGVFCAKNQSQDTERRLKVDLPFLAENGLYQIRNLHLTDHERRLFDLAVTKSRPRSPEERKLRSLGFKSNEFNTYRDLIRFLPRYHESII